ncbi:COMM domain-containing protein 2 isoform X2 [Nelusetta ayraudi]|uniref:COMM domain-containing protein 2 isoform X2 n=1 Tax=Nelusetta ayraudi TaxID=303726 RepID=UPI003F72964D
MLLVLSEDHKEHLSFLPKVDAAVASEFCRIALEFLKKGTSPKIYEGAARKLGASVEAVQRGVEGLMYLMTESSKCMLYLQHQSQIRRMLSLLSPDVPAYHNLEWRLDVQLATRSVHHQVCPSLTMHLVLAGGFDRSSVVLQTDAGTLLHLISSLEAALATLKSSATRRVLRNIK